MARAMLLWLLAPALLASCAGTRFESDLEPAAWHSVIDRLAASERPQALVAAAALAAHPFPSYARPEALEWIRRAASLEPDGAEIAWLAVRICVKAPGCDPAAAELEMRRIDPANAASWMGPLTRALQAEDVAAIDGALAGMAAAERLDIYWNPLIVITAPEYARAHFNVSKQPSKGQLVQAALAMMGPFSALLIPEFAAISRACEPAAVERAARMDLCRRAAAVIERGDTVIAESYALGLASRLWPEGSPEAMNIAERWRVHVYRREAANALSRRVTLFPGVFDSYSEHRREQDAAVATLRRHRKADLPPADWQGANLTH